MPRIFFLQRRVKRASVTFGLSAEFVIAGFPIVDSTSADFVDAGSAPAALVLISSFLSLFSGMIRYRFGKEGRVVLVSI